MPGRDLSRPLAVINRFTVRGDVERFEREFREHSQYLRRQPGFEFLVTVRLVKRPDVYVHLGHWNRLDSFLAVVHDDVFLSHVRRLGAMVETEADQAVSVARRTLENAVVGAANVVLVHATVVGEHRLFETGFAELTASCERLGGFGGSDLLRSTIDPRRYTGLLWWRDTGSCDRALSGPGFADWRARQAGTAVRLVAERTRHVAYERIATD
ncbi:antibiotic biosynthesis monooxygenase family protein [Streptomyces xinghaiensis]|uniref:antibiotic biosynthesis monooxygenase family protein n=1 Tax=Streptomyces xinghaiensis TaxID=1038928 RepID=UPI00341F4C37